MRYFEKIAGPQVEFYKQMKPFFTSLLNIRNKSDAKKFAKLVKSIKKKYPETDGNFNTFGPWMDTKFDKGIEGSKTLSGTFKTLNKQIG